MAATLTVNDLLDGHVGLDIESLDRLYLNGYVPKLQVGGQVVGFMTRHLGYRDPVAGDHGEDRHRVPPCGPDFAVASQVPIITFGKTDRKQEVMRPYLQRQAATGVPGVAAIGVAQEYQNVFAATQREDRGYTGHQVWYSFRKADRRVTCFYFYLWDADFGPAFIKVCAYFPYPAKVWLNGHEWAKRQATHGRDRVHRVVQRVRHLHRPGRVAGDLRPARPRHTSKRSSTGGWASFRCR